MKKKVVIGMSGGVDSSVAAIMLQKQGYEVIGLFMRNWDSFADGEVEGAPTTDEGICPQEVDYNDAKKVCDKLGIPLYRKDFIKEYWDYVFTYFLDELKKGRTPNPDIMCNKYIKFDQFAKEAEKLGADYIATGHYARVEQLPNGRYAIRHSATWSKDQTYALYNLTQDQLRRTLMPVGEYEKDQIREIAKEIGLLIANKPDSQDICFVSDDDYASFIEEESNQKIPEGNFVTPDGKILGRHKGIIHYTIGQRKGLGLSLGYQAFVLEIRPDTNEVVIGTNEDLMTTRVRANKLNFMTVEDLEGEMRVFAKIRYNHKGDWCTVRKTGEDEIECIFETPQRAVTPGQALVLYDGDYVLGGGTILG